jgi:hypothetical protein
LDLIVIPNFRLDIAYLKWPFFQPLYEEIIRVVKTYNILPPPCDYE